MLVVPSGLHNVKGAAIGTDFWLQEGSYVVYKRTRFLAGMGGGAVETVYSLMNFTVTEKDDVMQVLTFKNQTYEGLNWDARNEPDNDFLDPEFDVPYLEGNVHLDYKWHVFDIDAMDTIINETIRNVNCSVLYSLVADTANCGDAFDAPMAFRPNMTFPVTMTDEQKDRYVWVDRQEAGETDNVRWSSNNYIGFHNSSFEMVNVTMPNPLVAGQVLLNRNVTVQFDVEEAYDKSSGATMRQDMTAAFKYPIHNFANASVVIRVLTDIDETWNTNIGEKFEPDDIFGPAAIIFVTIILLTILGLLAWRFIIHKPKKVDLVAYARRTRPEIGGRGAQAAAESASRDEMAKGRDDLFADEK